MLLLFSMYSCGFISGAVLAATKSCGPKESNGKTMQNAWDFNLGNMATGGLTWYPKHGMTTSQTSFGALPRSSTLTSLTILTPKQFPNVRSNQVKSGQIRSNQVKVFCFFADELTPRVDQPLPPSRCVVDEPLQRWILTVPCQTGRYPTHPR